MKKCAVYTRVSTPNQANKELSSCEAQRNRIMHYINSQENLEYTREYTDAGFTASSIERPGLQTLLDDIKKGGIQKVLTYKIDRLSRSLMDFDSLIRFFGKHDVSFVSVTEQFDTSTASGRLLLNILMIFAQFERELISERTRDKMQHRAENGHWNGGLLPLGYKKENSRLVLDQSTVPAVRNIFSWFIETGSSKRVYRQVLENNYINPRTNKHLSLSSIGHILRNPVYKGIVRWNDRLYQGLHEPIVSTYLFDHAQTLMKTKYLKRKSHRVYLLSGSLIKCTSCGTTMSPCHANSKGRRYYYYKCQNVLKKGASSCDIKSVSANRIEDLVITHLLRTTNDKQFIENLAFKQMSQLSGDRVGYEILDRRSKIYENRIFDTLNDFINKFGSASKIEKVSILRKLIKKIRLHKDSLEVIIKLNDSDWQTYGDQCVFRYPR